MLHQNRKFIRESRSPRRRLSEPEARVGLTLIRPRSLSVLLMLCPAQSERYFCSVSLNTAVSFEMKRNESIFDPIASWEGLLFVLV